MIRGLLVAATALVATVALAGSGGTEPSVGPSPAASVRADAPPPPPSRAEVLLERHDCWTGAAPPDVVVPTRAVVTLPGQSARVVPADVGFGIWLDGDPGVLHGFCR